MTTSILTCGNCGDTDPKPEEGQPGWYRCHCGDLHCPSTVTPHPPNPGDIQSAIELTTEQRIKWVQNHLPEFYAKFYASFAGQNEYRTQQALTACEAPTHLNALIDPPALAPFIHDVEVELRRALAKHPQWPDDPQHAFGNVNEECGELQREIVQLCYESHKSSLGSVRKEAVQLIVVTLRFLRSLHLYDFKPSLTHAQEFKRHST